MDIWESLGRQFVEAGIREEKLFGEFRALGRDRTLGPGENLVRTGEPVSEFHYLGEGWIKYFQVGPRGKEYVRYFCRGGHFVSAYGSLLSGGPSAFTIRTLTTARIASFSWKAWVDLTARHPLLKVLQDRLLAEALVRSEERERSLVLDDAVTRYLALLEEFPGIEDQVRQYDIASWLGITPVALSRIRGRKGPE